MQHAAFYGPEGLPPEKLSDERRTCIILDSIPLSCLIAICQKAVKIDPLAVMEDVKAKIHPNHRYFFPLWFFSSCQVTGSYILHDNTKFYYFNCRTKSLNEAVLKVISEIDNVATNWDSTKKGSVKLPGRDIQVNDVDIFQKLLQLNDFRSFLINTTSFRCRQCSLFREHVS